MKASTSSWQLALTCVFDNRMLDLLDMAEWNRSVLVLMLNAVPVGAPRERHDIGGDFVFSSANMTDGSRRQHGASIQATLVLGGTRSTTDDPPPLTL